MVGADCKMGAMDSCQIGHFNHTRWLVDAQPFTAPDEFLDSSGRVRN